jgi:sentrin-specific protease 8
MVFMLMQTEDPLTLKEALPDFSKTTHIFLPISSARNVSTPKGCLHWSLVIVSVIDGISLHYDSLIPFNSTKAPLVTHKIGQLLGLLLRFMSVDDSPQQENSRDGGVYVCLLMRHLLVKRLLATNLGENVSMSMTGELVDASGGRKELLKLIKMFRKEGERGT